MLGGGGGVGRRAGPDAPALVLGHCGACDALIDGPSFTEVENQTSVKFPVS